MAAGVSEGQQNATGQRTMTTPDGGLGGVRGPDGASGTEAGVNHQTTCSDASGHGWAGSPASSWNVAWPMLNRSRNCSAA